MYLSPLGPGQPCPGRRSVSSCGKQAGLLLSVCVRTRVWMAVGRGPAGVRTCYQPGVPFWLWGCRSVWQVGSAWESQNEGEWSL